MRRATCPILCALLVVTIGSSTAPASAQSRREIGVRGFAMAGNMTFTAHESFDAILDTHSGPIYGGGATVLLPWWDLYVDIGGSRFRRDGQRVFIGPGDEIFKLGIPVEITMTPVEVTAGYRYTRLARRLIPYGGIGYSSYRYQETSQFADDSENVDERFGGFHVAGGAEFLVFRWLAVGGEVAWSSIPDAIGVAGVSEHFNEDDIGGRSVRLKISVGR